MEETYQVTSALKYLDWGKHVAGDNGCEIFGVSTGACIGHVGPEALAGGPIGKVIDGDVIRIIIDRRDLVGSIDLVGVAGERMLGGGWDGDFVVAHAREDLQPDAICRGISRLWAALQTRQWRGRGEDAFTTSKRLQEINS